MTHSIDWNKIREEFIMAPDYIHLSNCIITTHPLSVRTAIDYHRKELDANPALHAKKYDAFDNDTLLAAATYLSTNPNCIALTQSTTIGLGIIYGGLHIKAGEEILTTTHDHYSTAESLRFKCAHSNAKLIRIPLYNDSFYATPKEIISRLLAAITHKTRVIALTWVHSGTGFKLPIKDIAQEIIKINASRDINKQIIFCVDGLHGFGIENFTPADLGCDFFIAGCHKSFYGPRGTGIVWGHANAWTQIQPIIPSFSKIAFTQWLAGNNPDPLQIKAPFYTPGGFLAFEHRWALSAAFNFHLNIGKHAIAQRVYDLSNRCKTGLMNIPGITLLTPITAELSSGMVCFTVNRSAPATIIEKLLQLGIIASETPYYNSAIRFAPSIFNTHTEIDAALNALEHAIK